MHNSASSCFESYQLLLLVKKKKKKSKPKFNSNMNCKVTYFFINQKPYKQLDKENQLRNQQIQKP